MVDNATHVNIDEAASCVHCGREQFSSTVHADDTQARHVRTRQCVNVLDHDVYVDCDGDLDMLPGGKGSWGYSKAYPAKLYPLYPDACREGVVARVERHLVWHCKRYEAARQRHPSLSTSATP